MEAVPTVLVEIERQVEGANEFLFEDPWLRMLPNGDPGVLGHPVGQSLLPCGERSPSPTPHSPQFESQSVGQQNAERQPKRRPLSVSAVVVTHATADRLSTWTPPVARWSFRRDTDVEQRPPVHAGNSRYRAWRREHLLAGEEGHIRERVHRDLAHRQPTVLPTAWSLPAAAAA